MPVHTNFTDSNLQKQKPKNGIEDEQKTHTKLSFHFNPILVAKNNRVVKRTELKCCSPDKSFISTSPLNNREPSLIHSITPNNKEVFLNSPPLPSLVMYSSERRYSHIESSPRHSRSTTPLHGRSPKCKETKAWISQRYRAVNYTPYSYRNLQQVDNSFYE